ncbi:hypothetical protein Rhopal_001768-T1 [Rhodotorula paludigena]|uniref:Translocation protein sec66 n=1 Tax=Rhodotorula paludigena TaxID=86838 RepID=A0AAV5GFA5_9BASI|nr:hypothetical protein Rhopal_001768-T1 [Rhodotorula paludigena]
MRLNGAQVRAALGSARVPVSPEPPALSILAPLSYVVFLVGSLTLFSKIYRRRQANKPAAEPWFPQHKSRDIYVSLLSLDPPPPRPILVAALLRRAMDDVKLIWSIRDAKTSLTTLLQKGQIGDDLWERFLLAEKELEAEIVEVVGEANTFEPGYGQKIFNVASDMVSHERWKDVYRDIAKRRDEENAKLSTGLPAAAVLAPTSYLTPSSLTLSPSNPLPTAGTSPAPAPAPAPSLAATAKPLGAPDAAEITDRPPSRESTPAPAAADGPVSAALKNGVATPQKSGGGGAGAAADPEEVDVGAGAGAGADEAKTPASAPAPQQQQQGTPKKTPNSKKGKRKPPVKGGR